jgi:hypothetical protein
MIRGHMRDDLDDVYLGQALILAYPSLRQPFTTDRAWDQQPLIVSDICVLSKRHPLHKPIRLPSRIASGAIPALADLGRVLPVHAGAGDRQLIQ